MTVQPGMDKDDKKPRAATQLTHLGRTPFAQEGFVNPPVYRGSTVLFQSADALRRGAGPYIYGRKGTPTTRALSDALANLDGAALSLLTPSGLLAITSTILALVKPPGHILMVDSVYWPARDFCQTQLARLGITTTFYDPVQSALLPGLVQPDTQLIFAETPGSLMFEMQDTEVLVALARQHGVWLVMDNTWGTPLYFQPLAQGADVAIQSATKYITGHSDAMLGVISANERAAEPLRTTYEALGICPGSEEVFLGLRGLRSLSVRLAQHRRNAQQIANWLQNRDDVSLVLYPPLPSAPGHEQWQRDFSGGSGLLSFILPTDNVTAIDAFLDALELIGLGWSWGGFESLMISFDPKTARSVTANLPEGVGLRLHVGLEDVDDIQLDLERGFSAYTQILQRNTG